MAFARPRTAFAPQRSPDVRSTISTSGLGKNANDSGAASELSMHRPKTAAAVTAVESTDQSRDDQKQPPASRPRTAWAAAGSPFNDSRPPSASGVAKEILDNTTRSARPQTAGPLRSPGTGSPGVSSPALSSSGRLGSAGGSRGSPLAANRSLAEVLEKVRSQSRDGTPESSPRPASAAKPPRSPVATTAPHLQKSMALLKESALLRDSLSASGSETSLPATVQVSLSASGSAIQLNDVRGTQTMKSNKEVFSKIRSVRDESAHLQQSMLQLGEEQKLLGKCKSLLEVAVHDKRKGLSINHQSQALRQKMSAKDQRLSDGSSLALAKEARHLSQSKRDLEKQLAQVKSQQWEVEKLRKLIATRQQGLDSGPLSLDCHNDKVTSHKSSSHDRYSTSRRRPLKAVMFEDTASAASNGSDKSPLVATKGVTQTIKLLTQSSGLLEASKTTREESKRLVTGTTEQVLKKKDATNAALKDSVKASLRAEGELSIERARVRHGRSASAHAINTHQLAADKARGAELEEHWSVAEKSTRPLLLAADPDLGTEEEKSRQAAMDTFHERASGLSASLDRYSKVDSRLAMAVRRSAAMQRSDMDIVRLRRRSADNRWVQG